MLVCMQLSADNASEQTRKAVSGVIAQLRNLPPVERIEVGHAVSQTLLDLVGDAAAARRSAVRELRRTYTVAEIADMTGLTRARIHQMELGTPSNGKKTLT